MTPTIHEASPLEMEVIQLLIQRIWKPTYNDILTEDQMDYMLARMYSLDALQQQMDEGHVFLILMEDNTPVGFASFEYDYPKPGTSKLHKLYLLPETQGKGLGKLLLNAVTERVKLKQQQQLLLNVNRFNKAKHFYEKNGFAVIAEEDIDIGRGYFMNDYVMGLSL